MRIVDARRDDPFEALKSRAPSCDESVSRIVEAIIEDVRRRGDEALLESARKFDSPHVQSLAVSDAEIDEARVPEEQAYAIQVAAERVLDFHRRQFKALIAGDAQPREWYAGGPFEGRVGGRYVPIDTAGVYAPRGAAGYPSSILMNVLPARAAGVRDAIVTTPAGPDGTLSPSVLVALRAARYSPGFKAFKVGGAAAVAALALGTESVPRVDKVVGPGNKYVNEAKRQLWGTVGLDGYAGPSEVCVLADGTACAKFAAADLLTQIEHAPDNCPFLVCDDEAKLREILDQVEAQAKGAPREHVLREALTAEGIAFLARDKAQAIDIVNALAVEHLSIMTSSPDEDIAKIRNAGCIFVGDWSPQAAGDFCVGPSHTLPTAAAARFDSPVNVLTFLKVQSVIRLSREQLEELAPVVETFGVMEDFPTHGRGATCRFEEETR
jgi:histidinol dehydrogenase